MTTPLVSVVVPIFKVEPYLQKCVSSLLSQTYKNIEVVLVDDGSPDGCPAICDRQATEDSRVRVVHKRNGGLVSARKAGLASSTGDFICSVDGDDWVEPVFVEELVRTQSETGADVVADGHRRDIGAYSERVLNEIPCGLYKGKALVRDVYPRMLCAGDYFYFGLSSYLWSKMFRREILEHSQMAVADDIAVGEDVACVYPALLEADSLCVIESSDYHYRQRANSMLKTRCDMAEEARRLNLLETHLSQAFSTSPHVDVLMPQLKRYMSGIRAIRTDYNIHTSGSSWNPFGSFEPGERVAIYSAGSFGQQLYARMCSSSEVNFVAWYDRDFDAYRKECLPVDAPSGIDSGDFDKILVASLDMRFIERAKAFLDDKGVMKEQIVALETMACA